MACHHDMLRGSVKRLGLNIGLLSHHRYPRLTGSWAEAVVRHPSSPREPAAKIPVLREAGCWFAGPALHRQLLIFSYHKSGTTLFHRIMHGLAARLGLSIHVQYGMVYDIDADTDIVLLPHSLLGFSLARNYRAVRIVRDPRDIWVSSYLYHCRTAEGWCVNTNFDLTPPITYPRVDFSMLHRPERWKRAWLARLGGKSYQRNLQEGDLADGLAFELEGYTSTTLAAMSAWRPLPGVLDVKLEDIAAAFDTTMTRVFRHLGLTDQECMVAMDIAATEDIDRKDDAAVAADPHIHSRVLSKWRDVLTAEQVQTFEQRYAGLVRRLGYELTPAP
jgi:hypothetical protein